MYPLIFTAASKLAAQFRKETEEVAQVGIELVLRRFNSFDPKKGFRASTYFLVAAKRAMFVYCKNVDNAIVLPMNDPKPEKQRRQYAEKARFVHSLNATVVDAQEHRSELGDLIADDTDTYHEVETREEVQALRVALSRLPERLRHVIQCRMRGETLQHIGNCLGISKERARQLVRDAHRKLREILDPKRLAAAG